MLNKNINIPFIGISVIAVVGVIWSAANFFNIRNGMVLKKSNIYTAEIDAAALESDRQVLLAAESDVSFLAQSDILSGETDQALDDISESSDAVFDEESLNDEALAADISGDISALDGRVLQNEVDQSMNDIVQF